MYKTHPSFVSPNDDEKIWRFIDFTKFVSMLETSSLYFCRPDLLGDPFEGTHTEATIQNLRKNKELNPTDKKRAEYQLTKSQKQWNDNSFVNCWHINKYEPAGMWKNYTQDGQGIAIFSTFKKLKDSFSNAIQTISIGKVTYKDYKEEEIPFGNAYLPLLHKRVNFAHENELRAISFDIDEIVKGKTHEGTQVVVNLDMLIEKIIIAPTAEKWFKELVENMLEKYKINKTVEFSVLKEQPSFS